MTTMAENIATSNIDKNLEKKAVNHLKAILSGMEDASGEFLEIRTFPERGGKSKGKYNGASYFIPVNADEQKIVEAVRWADIHSRRGEGIFIGVNPRIQRDSAGKKSDIRHYTTAFLDLDLDKGGVKKEDAIAEINEISPITPNLITDSGGGLHVYYFFKPTTDYEKWLELQETLYKKFEYLKADRSVVTDSSRVLRFTPFKNWKRGVDGADTRIIGFTPNSDFGEENPKPNYETIADYFDVASFVAENGLQISGEKYEGLSEKIKSGGRNDLLFKEASFMRNRGLTEKELFDYLAAINQTRCEPPLPESEVRLIASSASRYEPKGNIGTSQDYEDANKQIFTLGEFLDADFPPIEYVIYGLNNGEIGILQARPNIGKDQPLDSKIKMSDGTWKLMGDMKVGDSLASVDGRESKVYGVFPQGKRDVYKITFSDGRTAEAGAEHLWKIQSSSYPVDYVVNTLDMKKIVESRKEKLRISIPTVSGDFGSNNLDLPVNPWLLGALIGDGGLTNGTPIITSADYDLISRVGDIIRDEYENLSLNYIDRYSYRITSEQSHIGNNQLTSDLRELGLYGKDSSEKFIPEIYMRADKETRLELLRGLIDTDGYVSKSKSISYTTVSKQLAKDVQTLGRSLGAVVKITERPSTYKGINGIKKTGKKAYTVSLRHLKSGDFVWLKRKKDRMQGRSSRVVRLNVVSVEYIGEKETQCIAVTHPDKLYVTDNYVVTHNTTLALNLSMAAATGQQFYPFIEEGKPKKVTYLDFENRKSFLRKDLEQMSRSLDSREDYFLARDNMQFLVDLELKKQSFNLSNPEHIEWVTNKIIEFGSELVIIDTMAAAFTLSNENDNSEAERVVNKPLKELARKTNAAIILIHHIGKRNETGNESSKLYRGRGASAFAGAARLIIDMDAMRDGNGRPIQNHVLVNAAKIKGVPFDDTVFELDFPRRWFNPTNVEIEDQTSVYEAVWDLVDKPMRRAEIFDLTEAENLGISDRTLGRILKLGVENGKIKSGEGFGYYEPIELPEDDGGEDDGDKPTEIEVEGESSEVQPDESEIPFPFKFLENGELEALT